MRLISLHIENFGVLSDVNMDFKDGVNTIVHENGWGKSTLAEFIRVMFYGLEGARKKDIFENDRLRFQPWNGKYFGGEVTFETDGKKYKVERSFGDKDKDITFKLYDAETLLESDDYSDRLGEELFGVDSESFKKTCFVGFEGLQYQGINSTIGARVSSLDQTGDLGNYDKADKTMTEYINNNTSRRKTGKLSQMKTDISGLKQAIKDKDSVADSIEQLKGKRDATQKEIDDLKKKQGDLAEAQKALMAKQNKQMDLEKKVSSLEQLKTKKGTLDGLKQDVADRKSNVDARLARLPEDIPSPDAIAEADKALQNYSDLTLKTSETENVTDDKKERLEKFFESGIPEASEIDGIIGSWNDAQKLMYINEGLEQQIDSIEKQKKEAAAQQQAVVQAPPTKAPNLILPIVAIVIGLAAIIGFAVTKTMVLLIVGIVVLVAGAALFVRSSKNGSSAGNTPAANDQNTSLIDTYDAQIRNIKQSILDNEDKYKDTENEVKAFLNRFGTSYSRLDAENVLYDIKGKAESLKEAREQEEIRKDQKANLQRDLEAAYATAVEKLNVLGISDVAEAKQALAALSQEIAAYEKDVEELQKAEEKVRSYMAENPEVTDEAIATLAAEIEKGRETLSTDTDKNRSITVGASDDQSGTIDMNPAGLYQDMTIDEISLQLDGLNEELSQKQDEISKYNRNLEDAYDAYDDITEKEDRLAELSADYVELEYKYNLVNQTQDIMKEAKEKFIAKYMSPIKDSFDNYYEMISGSEDSFRIDANVNLTKKEEGSYHDIQSQSEGYGDAIGISMRLALLDVMYEKDKPVIILDDPFAGMDEKRLAGTKRLLEAVSDKYQVIYLTCHDSRKI